MAANETYLITFFPFSIYTPLIIDVTSKAQNEFVKFSPFYPIGGIPVPFTDDIAVSVEGIWQGLKVFETADVDPICFLRTT